MFLQEIEVLHMERVAIIGQLEAGRAREEEMRQKLVSIFYETIKVFFLLSETDLKRIKMRTDSGLTIGRLIRKKGEGSGNFFSETRFFHTFFIRQW